MSLDAKIVDSSNGTGAGVDANRNLLVCLLYTSDAADE